MQKNLFHRVWRAVKRAQDNRPSLRCQHASRHEPQCLKKRVQNKKRTADSKRASLGQQNFAAVGLFKETDTQIYLGLEGHTAKVKVASKGQTKRRREVL